MKILAADDNDLVQRVYKRVFADHEVRVVSCGSEGLKLILDKTFEPDIVFSDYDMGVGYMNGTSFCTRLREAGSRIPFVLVSGNESVREMAEACGAQFGLHKPFSARMLFQIAWKFVPEQAPKDPHVVLAHAGTADLTAEELSALASKA
jgi:CheY-like chemotaxis protein